MRFVFLLFLVVLLGAATIFLVPKTIDVPSTTAIKPSTLTGKTIQIATSSNTSAASSTHLSTTTIVSHATSTPRKPVSKPKSKPIATSTPAVQITRTELPYSFPAQSFTSLDSTVRTALVNILCMPHDGTLRPISGSGVIIDPRGVILTNAHVAQFVLLSESKQIDLECTIRTGSPAAPHWKAQVLFIPSTWVNDHYKEVNVDRALGTGEHDYALLLITEDMQGNPAGTSLPYIPVDSRANVAFEGDSILGAGYPAEFAGGIAAQRGLYAVTSISTIKQLLTFDSATVDVFSIGGVIEAQGGSSGGPVVNAWGYVVGIISTTSEGATTAERDLHALSLNYIDRDIVTQAGHSFSSILAGNLTQEANDFSRETAPTLIQKYVGYLSH